MLDVTNVTITIIVTLFILQGAIKGAYNVLIYRYLNNFTNRKIRTKLSTVRNIVYNIFSIIISLLGALLLDVADASDTILIIGVISTAFILFLLYYMKDKVGLKPEKYNKEDLKYSSFTKEVEK